MGAGRGEERPSKTRARVLGWVEREKALEKQTGTGSGKPREGQIQRKAWAAVSCAVERGRG